MVNLAVEFSSFSPSLKIKVQFTSLTWICADYALVLARSVQAWFEEPWSIWELSSEVFK